MAAILIVEDDPDILSVLRRMLPRIVPDMAFQSAGDALSALAVLEAEPIALVLTDIHLPGMSGIALAQEIQARWPATPIVLISGADRTWLAQAAQKQGVAGALSKPFRMDELRELVLPLLPYSPERSD